LEKYTYSSAVYDSRGKLLKIGLSLDDKYRLYVPFGEIPENLKHALTLYEDRWFYYHAGVNPLSIFRAAAAMVNGGRTQGASTITMQLARIIYHIDSRTIMGKIEQMLRAVQIEMFYSKDEILEAYFNLAPYGGNIEGIGAASIIYFDTRTQNLNIQQSMALAVVPQNPGKRNLAFELGREEVKIAIERLKEMWFEKFGDSERDNLSLPLYAEKRLPFRVPHFVRYMQNNYHGEVFTTLDLGYQNMLEDIVERYLQNNKSKGAYNASAMIVNYKTMGVLAYIGSRDFFDEEIQGQVDGTRAYRSPGSTLKPFIYALGVEQGIIHPMSMLRDVPRNYGFYTPENFDKSFFGIMSATNALIHSRNIPAIELLGRLEEDSFYNLLKAGGVKKLKPSNHYGLALALGGFELTMQDIAKMYAMLGNLGESKKLKFVQGQEETGSQRLLSREAAFITLNMLSKNQPIDRSVTPFSVKRKEYDVYWKTGTSYGYRDSWTAGIAGDFVVVVWVGNFDNTPNNHFLGRQMAGPLFFQIVRALAKIKTIEDIKPPYDLNIAKVDVCRSTGDLANEYCKKTVQTYFIPGVSSIKMSDITRVIPIDVKTGKRACRHRPPHTRLEAYDFWPSNILKSFELAGVSIKRPPAFMEDCDTIDTFNKGKPPVIHYPTSGSVYIVRSHNLENEKIALKGSLDSDSNKIYWYVNGKLIGESKAEETIEVKAAIGEMEIVATDNMGRSAKSDIVIKLID
jgi:penicillin-binding protein 1C